MNISNAFQMYSKKIDVYNYIKRKMKDLLESECVCSWPILEVKCTVSRKFVPI